MPTYRIGLQSANTARLVRSRRIPWLVVQLILVDPGYWHHSRVKKTAFRGRNIIGTLFKVQLACALNEHLECSKVDGEFF